MIFLTAHHLCVDLVSWRVILNDLQEYLNHGSLQSEKPPSFQTWCSVQQAQRPQQGDPTDTPPFEVQPANLSYWGMAGKGNTYADVECQAFVVEETLTNLAFGNSHQAFGTEPLDLFLAALSHSFSRTFPDRRRPTLFNEGHGRESPHLDVSRTVGWFTTISPFHIGKNALSYLTPAYLLDFFYKYIARLTISQTTTI